MKNPFRRRKLHMEAAAGSTGITGPGCGLFRKATFQPIVFYKQNGCLSRFPLTGKVKLCPLVRKAVWGPTQ
jgi:hypothetical protein